MVNTEQMTTPVTVGLVQHGMGENLADNLEKTLAGIHEAADRGANIVSTSELFRSRYFCQTEDHARFELAEEIPGPSTDALCAAAKERGVVLVASLFERRAPGLFHNTAVIIDAGGKLLGRYRKMHIPDDPLYYEKFYFTEGDLGFRAWDTAFGRIGVLVCWDQWYPEAARLTALAGAGILFYPTAIGWHPSEKEEFGEAQHDAWETMQRSHAIANGVFVAAANRMGFEPSPADPIIGGVGEGVEFWGQSFLAGPDGKILQRASADKEEVLVVPIDLKLVDVQRTHWPFLRDRRIDAYSDLTRRYIDDEVTR
jgi:N-carbamoylputrescine amidase